MFKYPDSRVYDLIPAFAEVKQGYGNGIDYKKYKQPQLVDDMSVVVTLKLVVITKKLY